MTIKTKRRVCRRCVALEAMIEGQIGVYEAGAEQLMGLGLWKDSKQMEAQAEALSAVLKALHRHDKHGDVP